MVYPPTNTHSLGGASHAPPLRHCGFYSHMEHVWWLSLQQCNTIKRFIYTRKKRSDNSHLFTGTDGAIFVTLLSFLLTRDPRMETYHK